MLNRVLLATGGTGGHIYPALAVAKKIREMYPDCRLVFAGGEHGAEKDMVPEAGIEFKSFPARGVLGKGIKSLGSIWWVSKSLVSTYIFLRSFRPEVVLGFGGYAGFIPVLTAQWMKIPTAVHEQNSLPGMTNRVLGRKVNRVMLTFEDIHDLFPQKKVVQTGTPVRPELISREEHAPSGQDKNLLILGGSQGAQGLNQAVMDNLEELKAMGISIWHQTGPQDYEWVKETYEFKYPEARVEPYIHDMRQAYDFASLVLCRAGASTLSELCVAGKPSVLIPFPYATHNHQMVNAQSLEKAGAARVLDQKHLQEVNLAQIIGNLLSEPAKLQEMSRAAHKLGRPDAAEQIVRELVKLKSGS